MRFKTSCCCALLKPIWSTCQTLVPLNHCPGVLYKASSVQGVVVLIVLPWLQDKTWMIKEKNMIIFFFKRNYLKLTFDAPKGLLPDTVVLRLPELTFQLLRTPAPNSSFCSLTPGTEYFDPSSIFILLSRF